MSSKSNILQTSGVEEAEVFETTEEDGIGEEDDILGNEEDEELETEDDAAFLISSVNIVADQDQQINNELSNQRHSNAALFVGDSDCSFYQVSDAICTQNPIFILNNWTTFARALDTSEYLIEIARDDMLLRRKNINDIVIEFLTRWRNSQSDNATLTSLISILSQNGFEAAARELKEAFNIVDDTHDDTASIVDNSGRRYVLLGFIIFALVASAGIVIALVIKPEGPKFCQTLPKLPSNYISRLLQPRSVLDDSKLFKIPAEENILVFFGATYQQIKSMFPIQTPQEIKYAIKYRQIKSNYITDLEEISDFETLCRIGSDKTSVNWINYHDKQFTWVRTCGKINFVSNLVNLNASTISENMFRSLIEFKNHTSSSKHYDHVFNNSLIIVGENGMGKSTLLACIGNRTNELSPNVIVVFSDMPTFTLRVKEFLSRNANLKSAILNVVSNITCLNKICKNFIKNGIRSGSQNFLVLLDGFDQISNNDKALGISILQAFKQLNSTFLVVTSQSRLINYLEEHLVTLAYQLRPFDETSQIEFLVKFWNSSYTSALNISYLNEYANYIVDWLKTTLTETEKELAGIALETVLIADAYKDDATNYADENNIIHNSHTLSSPMFNNMSLYNLFTYMINQKICGVVKNCQNDTGILYYHSYQALSLKFPNISFPSRYSYGSEIIEKIGLLEKYDETENLKFIHPSFMDYFVSWYLLNCEHKEMCTTVSNIIFQIDHTLFSINSQFRIQCWLRSVSYSFREHVCLYFLDSASNLNADIVNFVNANAINKTSLLLASVQHNFLSIFELFKDHIDESNYEFVYMTSVLFSQDQYALENTINTYNYTNSKNLSKIVSGSCAFGEKSSEFPITLLHLSIIRGDESINDFLLNHEPVYAWGKFCLHFCVSSLAARKDLLGHPFNKNFNDQRILKKNTLIDLFLNNSMILLEEDDTQYESCPPLFSADTFDTIVYLLEKGANPFYHAGTINICDFMSWTMDTLPSNQFDNIMSYLNTTNTLSSFFVKPSYSIFITSLAIGGLNTSITTLELFKDAGVNFTLRSNLIATPLDAVIVSMKSVTFIERVVKYQTNWRSLSKTGYSALALSSLSNNIVALDFFLTQSPEDVDNRDYYNKTPLYYATGCGQKFNNTEIQAKLLKNNADPQKPLGKNNETPLLNAARFGPLKLIRLLVSASDAVYKTDSLGNTVLHYAVWYEYNEPNFCEVVFPPPDQDLIVNFLIHDLKFNVNSKNSENYTALEVAVRNYTAPPMILLSSMKILIDRGAILNEHTRYLCIRNAMRCPSSFREDNLDEQSYVTYVNTIKVHDLTRKDTFGNTLLHVATQENCLNGVKYLVRNHIDTNMLNSAGHTALYYMNPVSSNKTTILIYNFLKNHGAHV